MKFRPQPQPMIPDKLQIFTLSTGEIKTQRCSRRLHALLTHLQCVARTWDIQGSLSFPVGPVYFARGCKYLHDQISTLNSQNKPRETWTSDDYAFESLRLACLIYCSNGVEMEQTRWGRRRARLQELHKLLNHTNIAKDWTNIPGALIWCLAVGANESWGCPEYSLFMANLMPMLLTLAMECWKELERTLNVFSWLFKCCQNSTVLARF
jgi:hypothetical protein